MESVKIQLEGMIAEVYCILIHGFICKSNESFGDDGCNLFTFLEGSKEGVL